MNESKQSLLSSTINLIFRDARIIIIVWGVCILVAVIAALVTPKTYEAKSTLLVKFGREYVYRTETGDQRSIAPQRAGMGEAINSEVQILASRDLKEQVIEAVGIDRLYPDAADADVPLEDAIEEMQEALDIRSIEDSSIINLYFRHKSPELAAETLNKLVDLFKAKRLDVYRDSDVSFFKGESTRLTAILRETEADFVTFKADNEIFELPEQTNLLVERRNRLSTGLADSEIAISELREKYVALAGQLVQLPKTIVFYTEANKGQMLDEARSQLFALRLEEKQLLGTYREDSKAVTNVRNKIEQLNEFLSSQDNDVSGQRIRTGPNEVYQTLQAEQLSVETELFTMEARRNAILLQMEEVESEINRMASLNSKYDEMARDVENNRRALQAQSSNLSDAQAFAALDDQNKTNIRVVQSAVPPNLAMGMSRTAKVLLSVPLGLLAGVLVALFLNMFATIVAEPITIERKSELDVLATIDRSD